MLGSFLFLILHSRHFISLGAISPQDASCRKGSWVFFNLLWLSLFRGLLARIEDGFSKKKKICFVGQNQIFVSLLAKLIVICNLLPQRNNKFSIIGNSLQLLIVETWCHCKNIRTASASKKKIVNLPKHSKGVIKLFTSLKNIGINTSVLFFSTKTWGQSTWLHNNYSLLQR